MTNSVVYIVLYRNNNLTALEEPFSFRCHAENIEHAEEQLLDAEPDADIVWAVQTSDPNVALQDYYSTNKDNSTDIIVGSCPLWEE